MLAGTARAGSLPCRSLDEANCSSEFHFLLASAPAVVALGVVENEEEADEFPPDFAGGLADTWTSHPGGAALVAAAWPF